MSVLDIGDAGGKHYIVMEVVKGGTAKEYIEAGGAMNWPEATRVVADAGRGLAAAHAQGVIHRDIKPVRDGRSA